jgi:hypothetical protein
MKRITFLFIALLSLKSWSQCDSTKWAKPGTYQIVPISQSVESVQANVQIQLSSDDLCTIESKRDNNNTVEWVWNDAYLIRIHPRNMSKNNSVK